MPHNVLSGIKNITSGFRKKPEVAVFLLLDSGDPPERPSAAGANRSNLQINESADTACYLYLLFICLVHYNIHIGAGVCL